MSESLEISGLCALRRDLSGCELAALVDLASGTCLLTSAEIEVGQEKFDALCREGTSVLRHGEGELETFALALSSSGTRLFVRDGADSREALCLLFSPAASVSGVEERGRAFLRASG